MEGQGGSPLPSHLVWFFSMSSNQSDLHSHGGRERAEFMKRSSRGEGGDKASVREGRGICGGLSFTLMDQFRAESLGLLKAYTQP